MGSIRFRKQFKIAPGVKLNVNKQSLSVTTGVRGAHATYNTKGYRTLSAGLPGTGLSYRDTRVVKKAAPQRGVWTEIQRRFAIGFALGIPIGIFILFLMTQGVHR